MVVLVVAKELNKLEKEQEMKIKSKKILALGGVIPMLGMVLSQPTDNQEEVKIESPKQVVIIRNIKYELPKLKSTEKEKVVEIETEINSTEEIIVEKIATETTEPKQYDVNKKYVLGFGWVEIGGENICNHAEDMYSNGNRVGKM